MKRSIVTSTINPVRCRFAQLLSSCMKAGDLRCCSQMEALLSMRTKFKDMQQQSGSPSKLRKICLTETTMSIADEKDESYSSISRMSTAAKPSLAGSWHAEVDDCELNFDDGYENDNETSSKNSNTGVQSSRHVGGTDHRRGLALSVSNVSTLGKEQCFIPVDIDHDKMVLLQTIRTAIECCSSKIRNAKELSASTAISMALSEMEKQFVQLKQHVQQVQHVLPKAATNLVAEYKSLKHGLCQLSEKAEILKVRASSFLGIMGCCSYFKHTRLIPHLDLANNRRSSLAIRPM